MTEASASGLDPERTSHKFKRDEETFDQILIDTINEAVCSLEDKQDKEQQYAEKASSTLEAIRRTHEGIDYELEQEEN